VLPGGIKNGAGPEQGQGQAIEMGSGVYKVRVARPGAGKSGGYRIIVFFRSRDKTFYHYGYPKSARDNIDPKELKVFKRIAKRQLGMTDKQLDEAVKAGKLIEI
jgi:hypothetical protein